MIVANNIGPKELHRRILGSKPVCVVVAPCDQVNSKLLDVVDQVRDAIILSYHRRECHCCIFLWVVNCRFATGYPLWKMWECSLSNC